MDYKMANYPFIKKLKTPTKILFKVQKYNRESIQNEKKCQYYMNEKQTGFRMDKYKNLKYHSTQIFHCEKITFNVNRTKNIEETKVSKAKDEAAASDDKEIP